MAATQDDANALAEAIQTAFDGSRGLWGSTSIQLCALKEDGISDDVVIGTGDQDTVLPTSKTAAIADFNSGVNTGMNLLRSPGAYSTYELHYVGSDNSYPGDGYSWAAAGLGRSNGKGTIDGQNAVKTSSRTIDFYLWDMQSPDTIGLGPFDTVGDDVVQDKLVKWTSIAAGTTAVSETTASYPGTTGPPRWPTTRTAHIDYTLDAGNISTPHYDDTYAGGWMVGGAFAIIKWTFND